jgi:hypothetical protein
VTASWIRSAVRGTAAGVAIIGVVVGVPGAMQPDAPAAAAAAFGRPTGAVPDWAPRGTVALVGDPDVALRAPRQVSGDGWVGSTRAAPYRRGLLWHKTPALPVTLSPDVRDVHVTADVVARYGTELIGAAVQQVNEAAGQTLLTFNPAPVADRPRTVGATTLVRADSECSRDGPAANATWAPGARHAARLPDGRTIGVVHATAVTIDLCDVQLLARDPAMRVRALVHELGHALGLQHAPRDGGCEMMSASLDRACLELPDDTFRASLQALYGRSDAPPGA